MTTRSVCEECHYVDQTARSYGSCECCSQLLCKTCFSLHLEEYYDDYYDLHEGSYSSEEPTDYAGRPFIFIENEKPPTKH